MTTRQSIPTAALGRTGRNVTIVGLGGEGILRTHNEDDGAGRVLERALAEGITYFDSARAYAGSEAYYGHVWQRRPSDRARVFQTSKSASRTKKEALSDLHRSLRNLNTDYLDLWQIHDVRTGSDLKTISGPGGALEAFVEAKAAGKTRFIGVTGHHDPVILTQAVEQWPVDTVLMPVNPVEKILGGFLTSTISAARGKSIAVIGMKVLGGSYYVSENGVVPAKLLLRFALSQPVDLIIVGCSSPQEVSILAETARYLSPLSENEEETVLERFRINAGKLAFYRGTLGN
jgi:aryl-alcohol dehydrogenase-like predicted oxidoreductase